MPGALRQSIDDDEIARGAGVLPAPRMKQAAPGSDVKTLGKDPKQLQKLFADKTADKPVVSGNRKPANGGRAGFCARFFADKNASIKDSAAENASKAAACGPASGRACTQAASGGRHSVRSTSGRGRGRGTVML